MSGNTKQRPVIVALDRVVTAAPRLDAFKYRPECGWATLQRACFWLLARIGCFDMDVAVRSRDERREIDGGRVLDRLWEQERMVRRHLDWTGELRFLIGAEDYAEIMREPAAAVPFHIDTTAPGGRNGQPTLWGMHYDVIPWMRGIVILPPGELTPRASSSAKTRTEAA